MRQRIEYIDLAKGICILMVIFLHCTSDGDVLSFIERRMCTFRMPLYFILSGLFFKDYGGICLFIVKKVNKLLIPFLAFYFLIGIVMSSLYAHFFQIQSQFFSFNYFLAFYFEHFNNMPNAIWFLLCLFEVNLLFCLLLKISRYVQYCDVMICILSVLVGVIGYILGFFKVNLPMWIDTTFSVIPFFCFGYILKQKTHFLYPNRTDTYNIWLFIICLIVVFLLGDTVSYIDNTFSLSFPSVYICGILGSLAVLLFAKRLKRIPVVSYIGRYSIIVLIVHHPIIKVLNDFLFWRITWLFNDTFLKFCIVTIVSVVLIPIMKKYAPYVVAQKDLLKI